MMGDIESDEPPPLPTSHMQIVADRTGTRASHAALYGTSSQDIHTRSVPALPSYIQYQTLCEASFSPHSADVLVLFQRGLMSMKAKSKKQQQLAGHCRYFFTGA